MTANEHTGGRNGRTQTKSRLGDRDNRYRCGYECQTDVPDEMAIGRAGMIGSRRDLVPGEGEGEHQKAVCQIEDRNE